MTVKSLTVPAKPCESCPYRKDVPRGIWDKAEYDKLRDYDDGPAGQKAFSLFLCHHSPSMDQDAVCRGWLSVHRESVAVRLLMLDGKVTPEQVYADPPCALYASGNEAADAGIAGVKYPTTKTIKAIDKLINNRVAKRQRQAKASAVQCNPKQARARRKGRKSKARGTP